MDSSLPVAPDDGDVSWSDSRSAGSDDGSSLMMPASASPWMAPLPASSNAHMPPTSTTMDFSHTGQLSPISTGVDSTATAADDPRHPSASPLAAAAMLDGQASSASSADSWSLGHDDSDGLMGMSGESGDNSDFPWDHQPDNGLMVPKVEPLDDDDFRLTDVQEAPLTPVPSNNEQTPKQQKPKRPRGRPRKHPLNPVAPANKVTKGRSKTGCLTCRKRKKKCDEAKPRCMNCEKNAVVCEGYPEKQLWKSGKERAEEERLKSQNRPSITMQPLFPGLETTEDRVFWKHYNEQLSAVLTVEGEHKNAFRDLIVTIAVKHEGLMHSILALSSKHIDYETPYGAKLVANSETTLEALQERSQFHHEQARHKLLEELNRPVRKDHADHKTRLSARYAQILCFLLETMAVGNAEGNHRLHLGAYKNLVEESPLEDSSFQSFVTEFFQYHIFVDELIRHPDSQQPRLASETWEPPVPLHPLRLLGVADGLFKYLSQITSIRNTIRANMMGRNDPVVDYTSLYEAAEVDRAIREWAPEWPHGDSRDRVSLLYKQMLWLYLLQTIYPPASSPSSSLPLSVTSSTTSLPTTLHAIALRSGSPGSSTATTTPPVSAPSSCNSSPRLPGQSQSLHDEALHDAPLSLANNTWGPDGRLSSTLVSPHIISDDNMDNMDPRQLTDEDDEDYDADINDDPSRRPHNEEFVDECTSPPPIRLPPLHSADPRVGLAIDECLTLLETFPPSDPAQVLLLPPCLVVGTACATPEQRARLMAAVRVVKGYRGMRSADRAAELLREVWASMDRGDWLAAWDWQGIARRVGLDFLCC